MAIASLIHFMCKPKRRKVKYFAVLIRNMKLGIHYNTRIVKTLLEKAVFELGGSVYLFEPVGIAEIENQIFNHQTAKLEKAVISRVELVPQWEKFFSDAKEAIREHGKEFYTEKAWKSKYPGAIQYHAATGRVSRFIIDYQALIGQVNFFPQGTVIVQLSYGRSASTTQFFTELKHLSERLRKNLCKRLFVVFANLPVTRESTKATLTQANAEGKATFTAYSDEWTTEVANLRTLYLDVKKLS